MVELVLSAALLWASDAAAPPALSISVVSDEADAVLAILAMRDAKASVADSDWQRLFSTEGYRRLEKRERGMGRPFGEEDFRRFVLSEPLLARRNALAEALHRWETADATGAAARALAYLPAGAAIHATIYLVIKPKENSFVADLETDPAIFLWLDPAIPREKFENTLAHELHHVGYSQNCGGGDGKGKAAHRTKAGQSARNWLSAFGEGLAMLAAAGGPDVHPHAVSLSEERARWDRDVLRVNEDFAKLESFFDEIVKGRLTEAQANEKGMSFFGVQGPWYTVGYTMAVTVERMLGRRALIGSICDPAAFLAEYNRAATRSNRRRGTNLPLWPETVLRALRGTAVREKLRPGRRPSRRNVSSLPVRIAAKPTNALEKTWRMNRLRQEIRDARRVRNEGKTREEDDRHVAGSAVVGAFREELPAVHHRHLQVEENERRRLDPRELVERLPAVASGLDAVALELEEPAERR